MALVATLVKRHQTGMGLVGRFSIAATGNYATGGMDLDFAPKVGYTNRQPDFAVIEGISGYIYKYDLVAKKVLIFQSATVTPAGTISAPVFTGTDYKPGFTVKNGTIGSNMTLGLTADSASANLVGGTGITTDRALTTTSPVGTVTIAGVVAAPTFSGTATTAAALAELGATSLPSGVTGDTIVALVFWIPTPGLT